MKDQGWWTNNCRDASPVDADDGTKCPKATTSTNYKSSALLKYCIPSWSNSADAKEKTYYENLKTKFFESEAGKVVINMTSTWKTNIVLIFTGLIVAFLFMWLMSKCARCLALFGIAIMLLCFLGGGAACIFLGLKADVPLADGTT